jgi:hypothetical protein
MALDERNAEREVNGWIEAFTAAATAAAAAKSFRK